MLNPSKLGLGGVRHLHTEPWGVRVWAARNPQTSFSDSTRETLRHSGRANPSSFSTVNVSSKTSSSSRPRHVVSSELIYYNIRLFYTLFESFLFSSES